MTRYADKLVSATLDVGDGWEHAFERIYVKDLGQEEIRWCYYKDGRFIVRPPDLTEAHLLQLLDAAVAAGVFSDEFRRSLKDIL